MKGDNIAQRLLDFGAQAVELARAIARDPQDRAGRHIADQLLRSATSKGANYEEARSAQSRRDFAHKLSLAAKEIREALYWLGLVLRVDRNNSHDIPKLLQEGTELVAILMSSAKTARRAD